MRNCTVYLPYFKRLTFRTAPVRTDGGDQDVFSSFGNWSQNIYTCATSLRGRIATVAFNYSGTGGLESLRLDKSYRNYSATGEVLPVWAVEEPNLNISGVNPIWGIVDEDLLGSPGLQTLRSSGLYLPASMSLVGGESSDTVASASLPGAALYSLYEGAQLPDQQKYSGASNQAILNKWVDLENSPDGIAEMINLILVDTITQWMVGSKSLLDSNKGIGTNNATVLSNVNILSNKIQYNLLYGIPVNSLQDPSKTRESLSSLCGFSRCLEPLSLEYSKE